MNIKNTPEQLTNRHIAKLITKLKPFNIPEIAYDAIKIEMYYLMKDILSLNKYKENNENDDKNI